MRYDLKMNFLKVSIITVCYNSEKTIEQTIQSVLNQTYNNIEYIIVDGASDDHTLDIIQKYSDRITLISETDDGLYHAMNKGIMKSSGEIIGILNSDDWYEKNAVEIAVNCLVSKDCELVYGGCTTVYDDEIMMKCEPGKLEDLRYKSSIMHPAVFVKRILYEKYGIFNQRYTICADYDLMLRFYECGAKMIKIPQNMAFFRTSGISSNIEDGMKDVKEIALAHWDGKSVDIKEKIEKYTEEMSIYGEIREDLKKTNNAINKILMELFSEKRGYVIFGAGDYGIRCLLFLNNNNCAIENFIDNASRRWGEECGGVEIVSPNYLRDNHKNVIIASVFFKEEIGMQLQNIGYQYGDDYVFMDDVLKKAASGWSNKKNY